MKIRNGFVSNSSSSSFIVAFPKKPKSQADVLEMMFKDKNETVKPYDHELSAENVAAIVFADLQGKIKSSGRLSKAFVEEAISLLAGRYYYHVMGFGMWDGKNKKMLMDCHWSYDTDDPYCGTDKKLLKKIQDAYIDQEAQNKKHREKEEYVNQCIPRVPYAYKSTNPADKKTSTDEEIAAYQAYSAKYDAFTKSDKKYIKMSEKLHREQFRSYEKIRRLQEQLARKDFKVFLKDIQGSFLATLSYSDNDSETGSTMEHGNIFRNMKNIYICQH